METRNGKAAKVASRGVRPGLFGACENGWHAHLKYFFFSPPMLADISRHRDSQRPCGSYIINRLVQWSYTGEVAARRSSNLPPLALL